MSVRCGGCNAELPFYAAECETCLYGPEMPDIAGEIAINAWRRSVNLAEEVEYLREALRNISAEWGDTCGPRLTENVKIILGRKP